MKIVRFIANKNNDAATDEAMGVLTIPDTALLIQKRPFFIPDFTKQCLANLCVAVRINRLGRSIHNRFAERYYDADHLTLGVHFVAQDLLDTLRQQGLPWDLAVGFDNAVAVSEQTSPSVGPGVKVGISVDAETCETIVTQSVLTQINTQIAHISRHYTLRQGDLLLLPLTTLDGIRVDIDTHLKLTANGEELLAFNIK